MPVQGLPVPSFTSYLSCVTPASASLCVNEAYKGSRPGTCRGSPGVSRGLVCLVIVDSSNNS